MLLTGYAGLGSRLVATGERGQRAIFDRRMAVPARSRDNLWHRVPVARRPDQRTRWTRRDLAGGRVSHAAKRTVWSRSFPGTSHIFLVQRQRPVSSVLLLGRRSSISAADGRDSASASAHCALGILPVAVQRDAVVPGLPMGHPSVGDGLSRNF